MANALLTTDLPGLTLISRGKVRDIYTTSSPEHLLFVATDRISVFDVILRNGIPDKGKLLTNISLFWFDKLKDIIPNHLITANLDEMPEEVRQYREQLEGRTMLVRKAKVVPLEAIVRGYITGSAWAEYQKTQTVHGIPFPEGLQESEKFPEPLFTPSTKAEQGAHDENITPEKAAQLIGEKLYTQIAETSLKLYKTAAEYALSCGLILADTKFEFGLISAGPDDERLILVDEVLTPDSSRYWPADEYELGHGQPSFDKQFVREALKKAGYRSGLESGPDGNGEGWSIDDAVIKGTQERYRDAERFLKNGKQ
ncbi:SAICAR synthetase [Leucogyrophana mollusca]|uniref:SAICAR synthetase n=1 Tax=Leucogyrophana mollusca TaxID=85980 RepID=A0ACB8BXS3_9AGAM|nr:SAICAR synthetase [Leucogyrophana mollusca]